MHDRMATGSPAPACSPCCVQYPGALPSPASHSGQGTRTEQSSSECFWAPGEEVLPPPTPPTLALGGWVEPLLLAVAAPGALWWLHSACACSAGGRRRSGCARASVRAVPHTHRLPPPGAGGGGGKGEGPRE